MKRASIALLRRQALVRRTEPRATAHDHARLLSDCRLVLDLHHVPNFRLNQVPVFTTHGWRNPGADVGAPDLVACLPGGRLLLIEAKTGKAGTSLAQAAVLERFRAQGALVLVVRRAADLLPLVTRQPVR